MTNEPQSELIILPAHGDPIRIVPLHLPDELRGPTLGTPPTPASMLVSQRPVVQRSGGCERFLGTAWKTKRLAHIPSSSNGRIKPTTVSEI